MNILLVTSWCDYNGRYYYWAEKKEGDRMAKYWTIFQDIENHYTGNRQTRIVLLEILWIVRCNKSSVLLWQYETTSIIGKLNLGQWYLELTGSTIFASILNYIYTNPDCYLWYIVRRLYCFQTKNKWRINVALCIYHQTN